MKEPASSLVLKLSPELLGELVEQLPEQVLDQLAGRVLERIGRNGDQGDHGWLRGAAAIAEYIGAPASRVYDLWNCDPPRIPLHRDGSALVADRAQLDAWIRGGGGKRPAGKVPALDPDHGDV